VPDAQIGIPTVRDLYWPTLLALKALGGSATKQEIDARVIEDQALTPEQLEVPEGRGPFSAVRKRLAWARTHLGKFGALNSDGKGLWGLTEKGRAMSGDDAKDIRRAVHALYRGARRSRRQAVVHDQTDEPGDDGSDDLAKVDQTEPTGAEAWKDQLLTFLLDIPASRFERLCQRLLYAAGFVRVQVTGRSGDGGIDGIGQYRMALVSFPVVFQSKRYRGNVGPDKVREFRGAMAGRGDKGLLISTGTFTPDAQREATRDGVPQIDLIDGDQLCDLLLEHQLGVGYTTTVSLDRSFFDGI
jgi:restriction system protein